VYNIGESAKFGAEYIKQLCGNSQASKNSWLLGVSYYVGHIFEIIRSISGKKYFIF
jgi:hypothetical protein